MCDLLELRTSDAPIAYLGGYAYYQKQNGITRDGVKTYRDLVSGEELKSNSEAFASLKNEYVSFVAEKSVATVSNVRSTETITKFVDGYSAIGWETYTSINDGKNKCAPIAITNLCKYWRFCKGKSSIYPSTAYTYTAVRDLIGAFGVGGPANINNVRTAWIDYVEDRGYTAREYTLSSSMDFVVCRNFIDWNRPFLYHANYGGSGHVVAVFGYQYFDAPEVLIVADAYSSSVVYKAWNDIRKSNGLHSCIIPY